MVLLYIYLFCSTKMMTVLHRKTERHVTQIQKHKTRTKSIQQRKTRKHTQKSQYRERKKERHSIRTKEQHV